MNTGLIAIDKDRIARTSGVDALSLSGSNSGNILFTHAAYTQTQSPLHLGFHFQKQIPEINQRFSALVLPAANWIGFHPDFGFLSKQLADVEVPLCCIGLGAQITANQIEALPAGTVEFLQRLGTRSALIGVRGKQTEKILHHLGVSNTLIMGCPSIFPFFQLPPAWQKVSISQHTRVSISFTRYGRTALGHYDDQRRLACLAARYSDSVVLQSESEEITYLQTPDPEVGEWICSYYDVPASALGNLIGRMRFFSSQQEWIRFHQEHTDLTISSRIHGCIASLLAGKPAILLAHDQRTAELATSMGIPQAPIAAVRDIQSKQDLARLLSLLDEEHFVKQQHQNLANLKHVYQACHVRTPFYPTD